MNNTSNSDSKAKLIVIIVSLFVVIALTFILKQYQNKVITEITESNTKQNELKGTEINQEADTKGINSEIIDSTSQSKEADKSNGDIESAGDMNGDTTEGVEITDEMKEYTESPESQIDETDNTAEEPKQEEDYVPAAEPEVDNTPEPAPTPEDNSNSNSNSGLDWGSDGGFSTSGIDVDTGGYGWGDTKGWTWQGADTNQDIDWDSGGYEDTAGWKANGTWHY